MAYDNIVSHKKAIRHPSLDDTLLEKPQGGGGQIDPPAFLELKAAISYTVQVINKGLSVVHRLRQKAFVYALETFIKVLQYCTGLCVKLHIFLRRKLKLVDAEYLYVNTN